MWTGIRFQSLYLKSNGICFNVPYHSSFSFLLYFSTLKFFDADVFLKFSSGIDFITAVLLLTIFIKLNPQALQIFIYVGLNLLFHLFLWKTSGCCQHKNFVRMFYCISAKIFFIIYQGLFKSIIAATWRGNTTK